MTRRAIQFEAGPDTRRPMRNDAELDRMHDAVVARFPGGLSVEQFRLVTLESANDEEDGLVYPPGIASDGHPLIRQSLLISMWFDRLLEHWDDRSGRPHMHQPSRYQITDAGRAWLVERFADGVSENTPCPTSPSS